MEPEEITKSVNSVCSSICFDVSTCIIKPLKFIVVVIGLNIRGGGIKEQGCTISRFPPLGSSFEHVGKILFSIVEHLPFVKRPLNSLIVEVGVAH